MVKDDLKGSKDQSKEKGAEDSAVEINDSPIRQMPNVEFSGGKNMH